MYKLITIVSSRYFLSLLGGILYAIGFPTKWTSGLFLISIIGMFFLLKTFDDYIFVKKITLKKTLISYLLFSVGFNYAGFYWIAETIKEFGNILFPFNYVTSFLFSLVITPHLTVFFILLLAFKKIRETYLHENQKTEIQSSITTPIILSIMLTLLEYFTPQQFPAHLGHSWLLLKPFLSLAPIFGAPVFSFMSFWIIYSLIHLIKNKTHNYLCYLMTLVFIGLNIFLPIPYQKNSSEQPSDSLNIRVVQANVGNFMKLQSEAGDSAAVEEVIQRYKQLSIKPYAGDKPEDKIDLIIWPETAYPYSVNADQMKIDLKAIPTALKEIIATTGSQILFGGYDQKAEIPFPEDPFYKREFNAALLLKRDALLENVYRKHRLIPFGETLPLGPLTRAFSRIIQNISYFASGENYTLFKLDNDTSFITPICYELLFSSYMREYLNANVERPNFIINLTNDSWYGDSSEPHQHLYLAKWRALEFNLPIIRSTNTGITSLIYANGEESQRLMTGDQKVLDLKTNFAKNEATYFQIHGIWGIFPIWMVLLIIGLAYRFRRKKSFLE